MITKPICSALLILLVSGCAGTESGFAHVDDGEVTVRLYDEAKGSVEDVSGIVAFKTGRNFAADTYYAYAGIQDDWDVGDEVSSGTAEYDVNYAYFVIDDIALVDGFAAGNGVEERGTLTLIADFDDGVLTGRNSDLSVHGDIAGDDLSGSVLATYSDPDVSGSIAGTLDGYIGSLGVIGAFHGHDDNTVMSGGFVDECEC